MLGSFGIFAVREMVREVFGLPHRAHSSGTKRPNQSEISTEQVRDGDITKV